MRLRKRQRLLQALQAIQEECENQSNCDNCPFYNPLYLVLNSDSCTLRDYYPDDWDIEVNAAETLRETSDDTACRKAATLRKLDAHGIVTTGYMWTIATGLSCSTVKRRTIRFQVLNAWILKDTHQVNYSICLWNLKNFSTPKTAEASGININRRPLLPLLNLYGFGTVHT